MIGLSHSTASGLVMRAGHVRLVVVVDYSDLVALAIVPLGYGVANNLHRFQIARPRVTRVLSGPSLAVALLAVLGTSVASYRESYIIRKTDGLEQLDRMLAARLIADVAKKNDLECVRCDRVAGGEPCRIARLTCQRP
jgi:hypothetical protein